MSLKKRAEQSPNKPRLKLKKTSYYDRLVEQLRLYMGMDNHEQKMQVEYYNINALLLECLLGDDKVGLYTLVGSVKYEQMCVAIYKMLPSRISKLVKMLLTILMENCNAKYTLLWFKQIIKTHSKMFSQYILEYILSVIRFYHAEEMQELMRLYGKLMMFVE